MTIKSDERMTLKRVVIGAAGGLLVGACIMLIVLSAFPAGYHFPPLTLKGWIALIGLALVCAAFGIFVACPDEDK